MLNRRKLAASNPLTAVPGCKVLLDARYRTTTVTDRNTNIPALDGELVDQWNDLSGNGNHYYAPLSSDKPTLSLSNNACNNRPCLVFSSNRLYSPVSATLPAFPVTVCFVATVTAGYITDGQSLGGTRVLWSSDFVSASVYAGTTNVTANLDNGENQTNPSFFLGTFDGVNSLVRIQRNEATGNPGSADEIRGLVIGDFNGEGLPYSGTMGFYAVWNRALTLNERNFLYHYCTQAFGININK